MTLEKPVTGSLDLPWRTVFSSSLTMEGVISQSDRIAWVCLCHVCHDSLGLSQVPLELVTDLQPF